MGNVQLHVEYIDGVPVALAFDGQQIFAKSLKGFMRKPAKKSGTYFFESVDSWEDFVCHHGTTNSEIWISGTQALAVLDAHGQFTPNDCAFRAELAVCLDADDINCIIEFAKENQFNIYFGMPAPARLEDD